MASVCSQFPLLDYRDPRVGWITTSLLHRDRLPKLEEETWVPQGQTTARKKKRERDWATCSGSSPKPTNQTKHSSSQGGTKGRAQKFAFTRFSNEDWELLLPYVNKQRIISLLTAAFGLGTYSWFNKCNHGTWVTWHVCQASQCCKPNSNRLEQKREIIDVQGLFLLQVKLVSGVCSVSPGLSFLPSVGSASLCILPLFSGQLFPSTGKNGHQQLQACSPPAYKPWWEFLLLNTFSKLHGGVSLVYLGSRAFTLDQSRWRRECRTLIGQTRAMCPPRVLDYTCKENQNTIIRQWREMDARWEKNVTITHNAKQGKLDEKNNLWLVPSKGIGRAGTRSFLETSPVQPSSTHALCRGWTCFLLPFFSCRINYLFYVISKVLLFNSIHVLDLFSVWTCHAVFWRLEIK